MEVRFFLTGQDVWNFQLYSLSRPRSLLLLGVVFVIISLTFFPVFLSPAGQILSNALSLAPFILLFILLFVMLRWMTHFRVNRNQALQGQHVITISPEGFRHRTNLTDSTISWQAIKTITADKHNLYFLLQASRMMGHVIPKRAFAPRQEFEAFLAQAQTYWANARATPPAGPAQTSTPYERWS